VLLYLIKRKTNICFINVGRLYMLMLLQILIFGNSKEHMTFLHWLWIFRRKLGAKTYYNWFVWNIRSNIGKECTRSYIVVWITKNTLVYVKDERSYLNTVTIIYKSIVNCETLSMVENVKGTCFVHAFLKARQYVTPKEKVCRGFKYISIKFSQKHL
jgi:hypothetical protein